MADGNNIVKEKAEKFAIRIVKCSRFIRETKREYSLADQLLRCGTSIGANLYEAEFAQSKADFISKMSIALKEASKPNTGCGCSTRQTYWKTRFTTQ